MKTKKFKMKKNVRKLILVGVLVLIMTLGVFGIKYLKDTKIDRVLKTESYSYLPVEAQNYVKEVYEKTGEIVLTEKNKVDDVPYLNPAYVEYLKAGKASEYGYIPEEFRVDHSYANDSFSKKHGADDKSEILNRTYYNLRDDGYITNVYNQGSEGLCWSFASSTSLESHIALKTDKQKMLTFSEKQVDYATTLSSAALDGGNNPYITSSMPVIGTKLNDGGNLLRYLNAGAIGISPVECKGNCSSGSNYNSDGSVTEDKYWKYPYEYSEKLSPYEVFNDEYVQYTLNEALFFNPIIDQSDAEVSALVNILKNQLVNNGSVYVGVGAYSNFTVEYTPTDGEKAMNANGKNIIYYIPWSLDDAINHAVSIIGWDDNYTHNVCVDSSSVTVSDGTNGCPTGTVMQTINGAWIIQNSWGDSSTYIYLPYKSLESPFSSISSVDEVDYDNSYRADSAVSYFTKGSKNERLNKVKFFSSYYNTTTRIYYNGSNEIIIRDASAGTSNDILLATFTNEYPGLYTVDLSDNNIVFDDDEIVLRYEGSYAYWKYFASIHTDNDNKVAADVKLSAVSVSDEAVLDRCSLDNIHCMSDASVLEFDDNNVIIVEGIGRNLTSNDELTFKIFDSKYNDVTNKFHIFRNYVVNNILNTIISYNNENISFDDYTIEVYYNGTKYDDIVWTLSEHRNIIPGIGTELNPYKISTPVHLNEIRNKKITNSEVTNVIFGYYELANDIDLTYDTQNSKGLYYNSGQGWDPIYKFAGSFDGKGYEIKGLYINRTDTEYDVGLFGTVFGFDNHFKNIVLKDFDVTGNSDVGTLIGGVYESRNFELHDISLINGSVYASNHVVGGILGRLKVLEKSEYHFYNLFSNSSVGDSTSNFTAGFIGVVERDTDALPEYGITISDSVNLGNVKGAAKVGGIVSEVSAAKKFTVTDVINSGSITGSSNDTSGDLFGALYNIEQLTVTDSYYLTRLYGESVSLGGIYDVSNNTAITFNNLINSNYTNTFSRSYDWTSPVIDDIKRVPMLSSVVDNFEFTEKLDDIEMSINSTYNINEMINPAINVSDNVSYSYDNTYLTIEYGVITPLKVGTSTVNVVSKYDGYSDDILVTINDSATITYHSNDETDRTSTQTVNVDTEFNVIKNPFESNGRIFKNWNTQEDGKGITYTEEQLIEKGITKDLDLYAQWTRIVYTINFDANGGEGSYDSWDVYYPKNGKVYIGKPFNYFTKENYVIKGWNTKADGSGVDVVISSDFEIDYGILPFDENNEVTLYVQWTKLQYSIYLDTNYAIGTEIILKVDYDATVTLPLNTYTKTGHTFSGWNTKADGSGDAYTDGQTFAPKGNMRLYAQWTPNKLIVKFNSNLGEGTMSDQEFSYGVSQKINKNTYTKQGYEFTGWNTNIDGTGTSYDDMEEVKIYKDLTLYAQWSQDTFYVIFDANGGEGSMEIQDFKRNESGTLQKSTFTRDGYIFSGWNTNADGTGTSYSDCASIVVNKNITLYAMWVEDFTYSIGYDVDEENKLIYNIPLGTKIEDFFEKIKVGTNYGKVAEHESSEIVSTGDVVVITNGDQEVARYTCVIIGDSNGDGLINSADLFRIRQHLLKINILEGAFARAADANLDGLINSADMFRIRQHLLKISLLG